MCISIGWQYYIDQNVFFTKKWYGYIEEISTCTIGKHPGKENVHTLCFFNICFAADPNGLRSKLC